MKRNKSSKQYKQQLLFKYFKRIHLAEHFQPHTRGMLNILPNECLVMIVQRISLQDRFRLRAVSNRWCQVIEKELKQANTSRKSLKLFGSLKDVQMYVDKLCDVSSSVDVNYWRLKESDHESDDLIIINAEHFNQNALDCLVRIYPNVQHLIVCFTKTSLFTQLPFLLRNWSKCLLSLSFCGDFNEYSEDVRNQVLYPIMSMTSLKRLDLLAKNMFTEVVSDLINNKTLPLEHMSLNHCVNGGDYYYYEDFIGRMDSQKCTSFHVELKELACDCCPSGFKRSLQTNFTRLSLIGITDVDFHFLSREHFENVQYLNIQLKDRDRFNWFYNIRCLNKLKNLHELRISKPDYYGYDLSSPDNKPLDSVKILTVSQMSFSNYLDYFEDLHSYPNYYPDKVEFSQSFATLFLSLNELSVSVLNAWAFNYLKRTFVHRFEHLPKMSFTCGLDAERSRFVDRFKDKLNCN